MGCVAAIGGIRTTDDAPMPPVNAEAGHPARPPSSLSGSSSGRSTPDPSADPTQVERNRELARSTKILERQRPMLRSTMTFLNPCPRKETLKNSLFGEFPKTFVTVGDAERLQLEVRFLLDDFDLGSKD